jgi:putative ribosome biogenesis GTPase RsgA
MIITPTSKKFYVLLCLANEMDKYADNLAELVEPNSDMQVQLLRAAMDNRELVNLIKKDFREETAVVIDTVGVGLSSFVEFCLEDTKRLTLLSQIMTEIKDKKITLNKLCKKLGYEVK